MWTAARAVQRAGRAAQSRSLTTVRERKKKLTTHFHSRTWGACMLLAGNRAMRGAAACFEQLALESTRAVVQRCLRRV